jgi:3-oxoacyl-[acyl-carrier protein] reductase
MKKVLITGALGSLGFEIAKKYLENNFIVYLHCRNIKSFKKKKLLKNFYKNYKIIFGDLKKDSTINKLFKIIISKKVDIFINNAGIYHNKSLEKISFQEVQNIFNVNFFFVVKILLKISKKLKNNLSLIVNINSLAGLNGSKGESIYSASKHATKGFFDSLDFDNISKKISFLNIYPGAIQSPITKNREEYKNLMRANEVADIIFNLSKNFKSLKINSLILKRKIY